MVARGGWRRSSAVSWLRDEAVVVKNSRARSQPFGLDEVLVDGARSLRSGRSGVASWHGANGATRMGQGWCCMTTRASPNSLVSWGWWHSVVGQPWLGVARRRGLGFVAPRHVVKVVRWGRHNVLAWWRRGSPWTRLGIAVPGSVGEEGGTHGVVRRGAGWRCKMEEGACGETEEERGGSGKSGEEGGGSSFYSDKLGLGLAVSASAPSNGMARTRGDRCERWYGRR